MLWRWTKHCASCDYRPRPRAPGSASDTAVKRRKRATIHKNMDQLDINGEKLWQADMIEAELVGETLAVRIEDETADTAERLCRNGWVDPRHRRSERARGRCAKRHFIH